MSVMCFEVGFAHCNSRLFGHRRAILYAVTHAAPTAGAGEAGEAGPSVDAGVNCLYGFGNLQVFILALSYFIKETQPAG